MTVREDSSNNERDFENLVAQLKEIERTSFSGNLIIQVPSTQSWMLSFSSGYLSQVHGGIDPDRRWQRNLEIAYLNLPLDPSGQEDVEHTVADTNSITQKSSALEVLFDIIQYVNYNHNQLSYRLIPISSYRLRANTSLPLLKTRSILAQALFNWQEWSNAGLSNYFPSKFVHVHLSDLILSSTYDRELQTLLLSIDGNQSLRDLAICHHKHMLDFTRPLLPSIEEGVIFFSDLAGYSATEIENLHKKEIFYKSQLSVAIDKKIAARSIERASNESQPLVACIDDELSVYQELENILTQHGYRSFGLQEPHKIITTLIQNKPNLIFLDLIMPALNGYEICERIRKISSLKHVPIVILSSRDGSFERERAKLSGANGFLGKPIRAASVVEVLNKYVESIDRSSAL